MLREIKYQVYCKC